ncbi:MAG: GAF domain-containing protein [Chloroflexota bacterium]
MYVKSPSVVDTTTQYAAGWRLFNEISLEMRKAKRVVSVMRILAQSLDSLGYQVIIGELNDSQTTVYAKFISDGKNVGTIHPITTKNLPFLYKREVALSALSITKQHLRYSKPELIHIDEASLRQNLSLDSDWLLDKISTLSLDHSLEDTLSATSVATICPANADVSGYLAFVFKPGYNEADAALFQAFCNLALMTMENKSLQKQTKKQEKSAETLREVSKIVSGNLHPETVLRSILEQLAKVINYDSAAVSLEYKGRLKLEAASGFDPGEDVLSIAVPIQENKLYHEMKETRLPIVIKDVRHDSRYTFWAGTNPIRSWMGIPLILRNELIGQISIDSFKKNAFSEEDGYLAFAFARHVATAIQNARLFDKANRTAHELRALLDGARDVSSSLNTERVIYLTSKRLQELMNADILVFLYKNDLREDLRLIVSLEVSLDHVTDADIKSAKRIAEQAIQTKEGRIIDHPEQTVLLGAEIQNLRTTSMVAPFVVQDQAVGAIIILRDEGDGFTQQDLDLLTRFALQTGIAIDNTRLYEQLERRLHRENLINRLLRRLSSKLSLPGLVEDIIYTVQHIAGADQTTLTLFNPSDDRSYLHYVQDIDTHKVEKFDGARSALATLTMDSGNLIWTDNHFQEDYAQPSWVDRDVTGAISIPLTTRDQVLGAVGLFKRNDTFVRTAEMMSTLEYIGWQTGVAIENALLFQQVNDYAHTLQEKVEARTAEIKRQKEETDAILESAADAIIMTSADGIIEYVNPAYTTMTGYMLAEAINQSIRDFISEQELKQTIDQMWNTVSTGKTWRGDIKYKRKDNSIFDADFTIAPIFDPQGQIEKYVAIQRDISKKNELDKLKSLFLVTASHELKTPLTTIQGYTELLLHREFSKSETDQFLKHIHDHVLRLSSLTSDIIDVSRIEAGANFLLSPQLIDPSPIFAETIDNWMAESPNHTIHFIPPDLWVDMKVDPDRLRQILNKLLSNAVKYSPKGGDIKVTVRRNLTNLHISIDDQGIGIALDKQAHLFETFWKADDSSVANEGTGLSMVVVKHIIESHGGKIWVDSKSGEGTTVNFTLPLSDGKATILIIEDDPGVAEIEERLLLTQGYHVITSHSGREGLELALSQYPDLIILDLMLPEIEGEDVLHQLKITPVTSNIPVVVVSAKSGLANIEYAFTIGAVDFLTKPFDLDEFIGRIKVALLSKRI